MTKDTTQPMEEPMTKNTIDDQILKGMGLEHIKDRIPSTVRIEWASSVRYIKQALYQDLMALVGENEVTPGGMGAYTTQAQKYRNEVRQELRQNINQYFKRGEGDE